MNLTLALRLTLRGDRAGRVRLLLMTAGVALGVALLLAAAGALPASDARQGVLSSRQQAFGAEQQSSPAQGVAALTETGYWRGRELHSLRFRLVGPPVPPPAGASRLPAAGEVLVSPALAAALHGPHRAELAARLPGEVTGRVGPAGLLGPDELYFLAAATSPGPLDAATLSAGFQGPGDLAPQPPSDVLRVAAPLAGVALVVPLLVLVATSTRLSAASRERRAAAMRLVGATARQVTVLAAVEGGVVGLVGAAAGGLLILALRVPVAAVLPVPDGLYGATVAPPTVAAVLILLGVPLLAAATGPLALRRVVTSPLAVAHQARPTHTGWWRLLPSAVGLGALLLAYVDRRALLQGGPAAGGLLLGGAALVLTGLAVAGATLARAAGLALHRWGPGTASQLAGRRLVLDPSAAARAITGTTLVVAVLGWVLAFLPLLDQARNGYLEQGARLIRPGTVVAALQAVGQVDVQALRARRGVPAVVQVQTVQLLPPGAPVPDADATHQAAYDPATEPLQALVADCEALGSVLVRPLHGCRPGEVQLLNRDFGAGYLADSPPTGALRLLTDDRRLVPGHTIDVPSQPSALTVPGDLAGGMPGLQLGGALVIPPALVGRLPASSSRTLLVATDNRPATVEAVRTLLVPGGAGLAPLTPAEALRQARAGVDGYRQAALLGVVAVVLAGGLTLAVSTADGLRERRRLHAALVAMGTPLRLLRRSVLLQVAGPLLLSVALAVAAAATCSALYLRLVATGEEVLPLPWSGYGVIAVSAVIASLLATAATLPLIKAAGRPDALRAE